MTKPFIVAVAFAVACVGFAQTSGGPAHPEAVRVSFESGSGLRVEVNRVPVIKGSGIQFYAPGWSKGYYSTTYQSQTVTHPDSRHWHMAFESTNGLAAGSQDVDWEGNSVTVKSNLVWNGEAPALVELTGAQLWGPAIFGGKYQLGSGADEPFGPPPGEDEPQDKREFSRMAMPLRISAGWGSMTITAPATGWQTFDARNWPRGWTNGQPYAWFGAGGLSIAKGTPLEASYTIEFDPADATAGSDVSRTMAAAPIGDAAFVPDERLPLIPFPKRQTVSQTQGLELTGAWELPVGRFLYIDDFFKTLAGRFILPKPTVATPKVEFDGGLGDLKMPPQGFTIKVTDHGISVLGQDDEGLRLGLRRLALLAYTKNGHLYLPICSIRDWPSTSWRGFHLFVGPKAPEFQKRLTDRVLAPLGYDHAVLQCGQTAWDCLPNVRGDNVMSKTALKGLFGFYRSEGIEPIPLIESFGHDEWLFRNGGPVDLAMDPSDPYSLDPRKPGTSALLHRLWSEAIDLLHPNVIHFGSDEVAMHGFKEDGKLLTELWKLQMPVFADIAAQAKVKMMLWGDEMLGPGEAPDAANAPSREVAAERRAALPDGTMIGDWHYKPDPKFTDFTTNLYIWKAAGMVPIAAAWYEPSNIAGFIAAAVQAKCGVLQTTWAGYYSSEQNVLDNYDQFAAFVLAADYSWSGRQDPPSALPYDYRRIFWDLYCRQPLSLSDTPGVLLGEGASAANDGGFTVGRYRFGAMQPVKLRSLLDANSASRPSKAVFSLSQPVAGTAVVVALSADHASENGQLMATVTLNLVGGQAVKQDIRYGWDVIARGANGSAPRAEMGQGKSAVVIDLPPHARVASFEVDAANPVSGLSVDGFTILRGAEPAAVGKGTKTSKRANAAEPGKAIHRKQDSPK